MTAEYRVSDAVARTVGHDALSRINGSDAPILAQHWECEHALCTEWATTYDAKIPHHPCRYAGGLMLPLVRVGGGEHVRLVERQDYVGAEQVPMHDGRPVMAAEHIRDDGYDTTVYAPPALATTEDAEAARDAHP